MLLVYYSGPSEFTKRFVEKLSTPSLRIPVNGDPVTVNEPFVLLTPTYLTTKRATPPQVVKFLNNEDNRRFLRGVIGSGNTNFNSAYCLAAEIVSRRCDVPILAKVELLGTPEDVRQVQEALSELEVGELQA